MYTDARTRTHAHTHARTQVQDMTRQTMQAIQKLEAEWQRRLEAAVAEAEKEQGPLLARQLELEVVSRHGLSPATAWSENAYRVQAVPHLRGVGHSGVGAQNGCTDRGCSASWRGQQRCHGLALRLQAGVSKLMSLVSALHCNSPVACRNTVALCRNVTARHGTVPPPLPFFSYHRSLRSTRSKSPRRSPLREPAPLRPSLRSTSPLKRTDAASARPGTSNGRQGAVLLARKTRIAALAEPKERRMTGIKPNSDCHPWH